MAMHLLWAGPDRPSATLVLAHSAGAPMDTPWLERICSLLGDRGIRTARFEFAYMAGRRQGVRRPPPRAELSLDEYREAVADAAAASSGPLLIGGKSYGGRVASMLADELFEAGTIAGLVCLGYPFHPPEKPESLRVAHLLGMRTPALICQGERDPFGGPGEVAGYGLSPRIEVRWFAGAHDVQPRSLLAPVADAVVAFADSLLPRAF
jgi:predicted alpha/beta-hydrolase family hydrolase